MLVTYLDCPTIRSTTASLLFKNEELQHFSAINISFFILTLYLHTCCVSSNTFINIENRAPPTIKPLISKCLSSYNSASFPVQLVQRVVYMSWCLHFLTVTQWPIVFWYLFAPWCQPCQARYCILLGSLCMYTLALVKISLTFVLQNPMNTLMSSIRWLRFTGHYKLFLHSQKLCKRLETTQISIQLAD